MWRRVDIRNYRSIEHARVVLAPFTVVVGPNGSGKSNFVDALVFAREISEDAQAAVLNRGGIERIQRWGAAGTERTSIEIVGAADSGSFESQYIRHSFDLAFNRNAWAFDREVVEQKDDPSGSTRLQREGTNWRLRSSGKDELYPLGVSRETDHMSLLSVIRRLGMPPSMRRDLPREPEVTPTIESFDLICRFRINPDEMRQPRPVGSPLLTETGANIASAVRSLGSNPRLLAPMQRIVPGLTEISTDEIGGYIALAFKQAQPSGEDARFNATQLSDGALRALGIIVAVEQMLPGELIIIEEPEASIHPGAANVLFDVLKDASEKGGVLITTHSPELLSAARDEEILVCELRDGATHIGPLAQAQREAVREGLFSVAELMRAEPLRIDGRPPATIDPATVHP